MPSNADISFSPTGVHYNGPFSGWVVHLTIYNKHITSIPAVHVKSREKDLAWTGNIKCDKRSADVVWANRT